MIKNFRFYWLALRSSPYFLRTALQMKRKLESSTSESKTKEEENYYLACRIMNKMRILSRTETVVFGLENVPAEGGVLLYANHQGKYDALGILLALNRPCGVLMEEKQSLRFPAKSVVDLLGGKRISFEHPKQQVAVLHEISSEVKRGRRFLIFPEGGYSDNKNRVQPFKNGCFLCATEAKCPIVPVIVVDSWRAMNGNSLRRVVTQVHFLPPLFYEEYKQFNRKELCAKVEQMICREMKKLLCCPRNLAEQSKTLRLQRFSAGLHALRRSKITGMR